MDDEMTRKEKIRFWIKTLMIDLGCSRREAATQVRVLFIGPKGWWMVGSA